MKKEFLYTVFAMILGGVTLTSCSEDKLSSESIITNPKEELTPFDLWLTANYVQPYNIQFKYRYEDNEVHSKTYYTIPSRYEDAVIMAHVVKYLCIEPYDNLVGVDFMRAHFPKLIYVTGEWEYKNNGSYVLGTAEGGKKIFLMGTAYIQKYVKNADDLNHYYLKTIHHEFTHILNQTKDYTSAFQQITGKGYVSDSWSTDEFSVGYLGRGFISAYAQDEDREDFAEMVSLYITNTAEQWEEWMEEAAKTTNEDGETGRQLIEKKLEIVRAYMHESWNIDLDDMRTEIHRRQNDVISGKIDLTDLNVN